MKSNITSYELSILKSIILLLLYITVGLLVPTAFNIIIWRPYGGDISAGLNIASLIIINIGFFIVLARITQFKVIVFNNISLKNILLAAIIVTTTLFAVLHFNFVQTLSAIVCGLILCLLYMRTKSLFCSILAHALYNLISFFTAIMI